MSGLRDNKVGNICYIWFIMGNITDPDTIYGQIKNFLEMVLQLKQWQQAFRECLVSPALISNVNVHKSVWLSKVKLIYWRIFVWRHSSVRFGFYLIVYPERCLWKKYLAQFMRYSSTLLNQCILGVTLNFDLSW